MADPWLSFPFAHNLAININIDLIDFLIKSRQQKSATPAADFPLEVARESHGSFSQH